MPVRQSDTLEEPTAGTVIILCPGGLEHGGGIGRQMGYFLAAQPQSGKALRYSVVDTRGPWFLGSSPWHITLSVFYLAGAALRLVQLRLSAACAVVHVNITGRGSTLRKIILTAICRALALPYLLHVHDYDYAGDYTRQGPFLRRLVRGMFGGASRVLVLGTQAQRDLAETLPLPLDRIQVLPNAVPDPLPARPAAAPLKQAAAAPLHHVVFFGYLSARKGVPELLRALATPGLAARPWRATLAGGGPVDEFRAEAASLGLADRVAFPGWVDQARVTALCNEADILVLPSHAEGLAMSVLEGLAHGLAVVTTPVGAHADVIQPEDSGLLVPPGDIAALAGALIRVMDDAALRARLREGARRRFVERFDVRGYADRLRQLHASLLARPRTFMAIGKEQTS